MESCTHESRKLSKEARKLEKKINRKKKILQNVDKVNHVNFCTKYIAVANAGLGNGMDREELYEILSDACHRPIVDIIMPRNKSFAIVVLATESDAAELFGAINGLQHKCSAHSAGLVFYPAYIESVCEDESSHFGQLPPGLKVLTDLVSEDVESQLWSVFASDLDARGQKLKNRRVLHYGYEFVYGVNNIARDTPLSLGIPDVCLPLLGELVTRGIISSIPDQLTVNEYLPGQGIPPHIDTHSACEDGLVSVSLGSHVVMDYRHSDGRQVAVLLPRRSVLVMSGESRYVWTHGITPRKSDVVPLADGDCSRDIKEPPAQQPLTLLRRDTRISLTFRRVLREPCKCNFPSNCDSRKQVPTSTAPSKRELTDKEATALENEHVYKVYETIAGHFSDTRHTAWPRVASFLQSLPPHSLVADIGCGNGKYLAQAGSAFMVGSDRSSSLCDISRQRQFEVFTSDILAVPLRSDSFDAAICIAVVHHLSTKERRLRALSELLRIVRQRGLVLVYVWALEQQTDTAGMSNYLSASRVRRKDQLQPDSGTVRTAGHTPGDITTVNPDSALETVDLISGLNQVEVTTNCEKDSERNESTSNSNITRNLHTAGRTAIESHSLPLQQTSTAALPDAVVSFCSAATSLVDGLQLPVHVNRTHFEAQDVLVPWHLKTKRQTVGESRHQVTADNDSLQDGGQGQKEGGRGDSSSESAVQCRYYHVFCQGELESLCSELEYDVQIVNSYYDKGNWCVVMEKC